MQTVMENASPKMSEVSSHCSAVEIRRSPVKAGSLSYYLTGVEDTPIWLVLTTPGHPGNLVISRYLVEENGHLKSSFAHHNQHQAAKKKSRNRLPSGKLT